jgi:hypothetical protein
MGVLMMKKTVLVLTEERKSQDGREAIRQAVWDWLAQALSR